MKRQVLILVLCAMFGWSCKSEDNQPLSDEQISVNLLRLGVSDPTFLIGEWDLVRFAYTADGRKISSVSTIRNCIGWSHDINNKTDCIVDISEGFLLNEDDELQGHELLAVYFKQCLTTYSILGNIMNMNRSDCWAILLPWTNDETKVNNALLNAYSFVVKGNELIIYFKGVENKNLLILKRRKQ